MCDKSHGVDQILSQWSDHFSQLRLVLIKLAFKGIEGCEIGLERDCNFIELVFKCIIGADKQIKEDHGGQEGTIGFEN